MAHPESLAVGALVPAPLVFDHLERLSGIVHGVFPRTGGTSSAPYASLNIGLNCGDLPESVFKNRRLMLETAGLSQAVFLNQVHGTHIQVLKTSTDINGVVWNPSTGDTSCPITADGVVTNIADLALVIQVADCQAVVLYDPVNRVIANVHSGWRGSVANILGQCVEIMVREFSCRPENILAGISPSLGPCCSEFIHYRTEIPEPLWAYKSQDKPCFDFWKISRDQLLEQGLKDDNIQQMTMCTVCHSDRFFSYRGEKNTGRFGAVIAMKKKM